MKANDPPKHNFASF